jgi:L-histidine N-alpha-methyltransferase
MQVTYAAPATSGARSHAGAFLQEVLEGLGRQSKALSSRYFYDARGSELFELITQQPEYYPTNCELEILHRFRGEIGKRIAHRPFRLIELGPGRGQKTRVLLEQLLAQGADFEYVPIDISPQALGDLLRSLEMSFSGTALKVRAVEAEYFCGFEWLQGCTHRRNVVLFLGSNIGNFPEGGDRHFLAQLRALLHSGDLALVGFDLKKDPTVLELAYNDPAGVTREFNFNLLERINRELGGTFDRQTFRHHGFYNKGLGRMESWLVSLIAQTVEVAALGQDFAFQRGEGVHVENSWKYDPDQIQELAIETGFAIEQQFCDAQEYFVDSLWRAT